MSLRRRHTVRGLLLSAAVALAAGGCQQLTNPAADIELQQSLYDLQDMLFQIQDESARLQSQVDSLQFVVAGQDSSLRRIANLLGAPIP